MAEKKRARHAVPLQQRKKGMTEREKMFYNKIRSNYVRI